MSLTLTATIAATARQLRVTGTVPGDIAPGYRFRLDDELLVLDAFAVTQNGKHAPRVDDHNTWLVSRGLETSDPASHTAGVDVLGVADAFVSGNDEDEPSPFTTGGAGQTADVQAALDGANAPDAGNVFATIADVVGGAGGVRLLDLGVVTLADVGSTLYTPAEGEIVGPLLLRDLVYLTDGGAFVSLLITDGTVLLAGWDSDLARDGAGYAANPLDTDSGNASVPTTTGPVLVSMGISGAGTLPFAHPTWEAETAYGINESAIIVAGHIWSTFDETGTSGSSQPDFAGNLGGTVADNDLTWNDSGVLGDGTAHVYAYVATPVVP